MTDLRVAALAALGLLDTAPEERFDRITRLASRALGMPIVLISLIDAERVWIKSRLGIEWQVLALDESPCGRTLATASIVEGPEQGVPLPQACAAAGVVFYGGIRLCDREGLPVGTLCVMDRTPRQFTGEDRRTIRDLAALIEHELTATSPEAPHVISGQHPAAQVTLDEAGLILSISPGAQRLFGLRAELIVGQPVTRLFVGREDDDAVNLLSQLRQKAVDGPATRRGRRQNGEIFPLVYTLVEIQTESRRSFIVEIQDQSAQHEAERLRREILATVSHRLRTPLTALRGSLKLISQGAVGEIPPQALELLGTADRNADRMATLIGDILDLEELESGKLILAPAPTALGELISLAVAAVRPEAHRKDVSLVVVGDDASVLADPGRIVQVLHHLLRNAITYAPPHSGITIGVRTIRDHAEVRVQDFGSGIAPEHHNLAFERFWQGHGDAASHGQGAGLGLAICRAILRLHGGSIGLHSAPGEGTAVWFRLPTVP